MRNKLLGTFGVSLLSAIAQFIVLIIISQILNAEGSGIIGLFMVHLTILGQLSGFYGGPVLVYYSNKLPYSTLFFSGLLWTFALCLIYALIYASAGGDLYIAFHIGILGLLQVSANFIQTSLLGFNRIRAFNTIHLLNAALTCILVLIFMIGLNIRNLDGYFIPLYISYSSMLIFALWSVRKEINRKAKWDKSSIYTLFKSSFVNQLGSLAHTMNQRVVFFFLESLYSNSAVGVFRNGASLAEKSLMPAKSFSSIQFAHISNSNDIQASRKYSVSLIKLSFLLCTIGLGILCLLPNTVYTYVFGPEFYHIKTAVLYLTPGLLLLSISTITAHYFSGTRRFWHSAIASMVGLIGSLGFGYYFVSEMGLKGAGIATSISYGLVTAVQLYLFQKEPGFSWKEFAPKKNDLKVLFNN
jgi:O-antigen/teichoic acid export membrane protein